METVWVVQEVFGDDAVSALQTKVRPRHFKDGREPGESDPCLEGLRQAEPQRVLSCAGCDQRSENCVGSRGAHFEGD